MRNADFGASRAASRPQAAVCSPQSAVAHRTLTRTLCLASAGLITLAVTGCQGSSNATGTMDPVVLSISQKTAAYYSDPNLTIYWPSTPVKLPVKAGTGSEANEKPYPAAPYLLASDYLLQINYTVTNLDNTEHAVWVTMNPWNQFVRYYPGVSIVDADETEPNLPGTERAIILDPMARVQGTFTSDDMTDLATKLAIAMDIMTHTFGMDATYNQATLLNHDFNDQFRTNNGDPLMAPYIPTLVAGLTGFDLGLLAYEQMNAALEIDIQLIDNSSGKFIAPGQSGTPAGMPPQELKVPGAM